MLGFEAMRMATRSLWNRKMRSFLTILGVVIGVGSVIAVVSLSAAFEASITSQFDAIDDRSIFVIAGSTEQQDGPPNAGQFGLVFTEVDREALTAMPGVERVVVSGEAPVTNLRYNSRDVQFRSMTATTEDADEVRDDNGKYLIGGPFEDGTNQMVLGYGIAAKLGGTAEAISVGDAIQITLPDGSTVDATVAGVLAEDDTLFGSINGQIFVPVDPFYTIQRESPSTGETVRVYLGFTVVAASSQEVESVKASVESYMTGPSDAATLLAEIDEIEVLVATAGDITEQIGTAFDQATVFIAAIAATSLLVGGIMIGTIMLITVSERTKEIGVMKAIGGLNRDILWMFLLEAAIIGLIGSLIGIALGLFGGFTLVNSLFGSEDIAFVVPWDWIGISMGVGIGVGAIAGYLPARRATKIQPVTALGYE